MNVHQLLAERRARNMAQFEYDPSQPRDDSGKWSKEAGSILKKVVPYNGHSRTLTPKTPAQESQMRNRHRGVRAAFA